MKHLARIVILPRFHAEFREYNLDNSNGIPKDIFFEKDGVSYEISGLESLTEGDKVKLENKLEILKTIKTYS